MTKTILTITSGVFVLSSCAGQNTSSIGTINGKPITSTMGSKPSLVGSFWHKHSRTPGPADDREIAEMQAAEQCQDIKGQIRAEAVATQKQRFAIRVSDAEAEDLARQYWTLNDPKAEVQRERDTAIARVTAITSVYDQGMDPHEAYLKFIAPLIPVDRRSPEAEQANEGAWRANLEAGRTPEGLAKLAAHATSTVEGLLRGTVGAERKFLERQRLDAAVDQEIAAHDAQFRADLDEFHKNRRQITPFKTEGGSLTMEHHNYLAAKRYEWWQARDAEGNVVLYDAALAGRCGISGAAAK